MKRWPLIRHVRWLVLDWQVHRWARELARFGIGLGVPHHSDLRFLDDVWSGKA